MLQSVDSTPVILQAGSTLITFSYLFIVMIKSVAMFMLSVKKSKRPGVIMTSEIKIFRSVEAAHCCCKEF
jgi:hypothetical protein